MKTLSKSKNAEQLYITKSIRVSKNKTTSKIVSKLGTMESLLPEHDNDREKVIAWAKEKAKELTIAENEGRFGVDVTFSEGVQLTLDKQQSFNIGYLFPKAIYHSLGLDDICKEISKESKISYNLSDVLEMLICARMIAPASKLSSYEDALHDAFDFRTDSEFLYARYSDTLRRGKSYFGWYFRSAPVCLHP